MKRVAGFTSTGSKHPDLLFGAGYDRGPARMVRSAGCRTWDSQGVEYLDFVMALGAVAVGYGHPAVNRAVIEAVEAGGIGPLAPIDEELLAVDLHRLMPHVESVRFLKSGAEATAAAVRLARVATGRERVLGCGYHGWLDWSSRARGVPASTQSLYDTIPFNDIEAALAAINAAGDTLACVVIEPVIEAEPSREWLTMLRRATHERGILLIYDEIKTAFRVAVGGAAARWGGDPDLVVLGKAMASGYPLAAFGGSRSLMARVGDTWISSTMATEFVSLAAARATLRVIETEAVPAHLKSTGEHLLDGLHRLAQNYPSLIRRAAGIPEMCHLEFASDDTSIRVARGCAQRGLLFKRTAYNFVSLAHQTEDVARALDTLDEILSEC